ncbi:efflux RND transporter periplasmic adaptor subunit [Patescibacteria group bacterium]|nr:efflux RND transporter periplasmic adaptor subunit [Patescibacteria group bacterium]
MRKFFKRRVIIIFIVFIFGAGIAGYIFLGRSDEPSYDFITAARKTLVQEVQVTGNVQPVERVDLSFEKTGTVAVVLVKVGQKVEAGQLLAQLDIQDAQKEIRDANIALENAQLVLEKIILEQQQQLRGDTLNKSYEEGLAILDNLYDEFQTILNDLDSIFFGTEISGSGQENIKYYANSIDQPSVASRLTRLYRETDQLHAQSLAVYLLAERGNGEVRLQAIASGYNLTIKVAETIKTGRDTIRSFQDTFLDETTVHNQQAIIDAHASSLSAYATSMDTYVNDLLVIINATKKQIDTLDNYPLDISSQKLTVKQREHDLSDAKDNLKKYSIVAPIQAVVTKQDLTVGEIFPANNSVITIISEAQFEIEANIPEADIAKIQVGNTSTVTLDAYGQDLIFDALVTAIDPAETIIEGVTTYHTILQFTQKDSRIKSGMTADITISTAQKENVIAIPQRAVIRKNGEKFVRIIRENTIEQVPVQTGLRGSNGTIEIVNGVREGDQVITFFPE